MNEDSLLSNHVIEEYLLFQLKLDKEFIAQNFTPRLQKHEMKLIEIYQQCEISESGKDMAIALLILVIEPVVRGQVKDILTNTLSNSSIVEKLLPFHRDIEEFLTLLRREVITYPDSLQSLVLEEKGSIQALLEELTNTIRQHLPDVGKVRISQLSLQCIH